MPLKARGSRNYGTPCSNCIIACCLCNHWHMSSLMFSFVKFCWYYLSQIQRRDAERDIDALSECRSVMIEWYTTHVSVLHAVTRLWLSFHWQYMTLNSLLYSCFLLSCHYTHDNQPSVSLITTKFRLIRKRGHFVLRLVTFGNIEQICTKFGTIQRHLH